MLEKEGPESPLLDRSNAAVKALIRTAKKRGYVTHDRINSLAKEVNSEQIENVLAMFSEMGINVIETEEAETEEASEEAREEPEEEETESDSHRVTFRLYPSLPRPRRRRVRSWRKLTQHPQPILR
jgi:CO dehydrogenase/acetyl-CoA synthase beta subunit